ncbi:hypothetical protein ATO11_07345 [Pseudaestuariivita atlantica]|uniref:Uncharacterized protein n=1 Tax=Pseudaestuariivita atlantica TaxID=1317121 RepID=A0A0L1JRS8_9RHOB|nr:hypothetical protein ATO11_07345 [Pseudaestuariivita atlantica]
MATTQLAPADTDGLLSQAFTVLLAGAAALLAFDIFGQVLSPMAGFAALAPVGLANSTIKAVFGAGWRPGAEGLHYLAGLVAYPLGWVIVEQVRRRILPALPWLAVAVAYGVILWVFALYVMAHLVAGMKPFLGWGGITYVALWGHILFAVVAAAIYRWRHPA